MFRLVVLSIVQSALLCAGQVMLKLGVAAMDRHQDTIQFILHSLLTNWWLLGCGIAMSGAGLLWMYILRHFPLGNAYPLTALSFVFGLLAARWFLQETVSISQWIGVICILIGCLLVVK